MWRQYPEIRDAIAVIERVLGILEKDGNRASESIRHHLITINTAPIAVAKEGFYKIGQLCHPKCLGDMFLKNIAHEEWSRELAKLEDACAKAFNRIEPEVERLRQEELK